MIWFYIRDKEHLRFEIRRATEGSGFELVITNPDGVEQIERFGDEGSLMKRSRDLEQALLQDGWWGPHSRDW